MAGGKLDIFGKNGLLMHSFQYYFLVAFIYVGFLMTNIVHPWALIFFVYGILPLLDQFFTLDWRNPTQQEREQLQKRNPLFLASLYLSVLLDWLTFFKMLRIFSEAQFTINNMLNIIASIYMMTLVGAVSFVVAHEIFHKPGFFNKTLGTLHMSKVLYMHFSIEHLYGHHKHVATPADPATAQKGVTLYEFIPKSVKGSLLSAYNIEAKRDKPFYLNGAVLSIISSVLFVCLVYKFYNIQATLLFLAYAFGSIFFLESINYIEHYGLRREKLPNGQYQKVTIRHSWNAPYRFTNYILFKLQRHSDHHENSLKPYQTLLSLDDSPNLPHGYSVMILMSSFPQTWFTIMDPLVDEYERKKRGDISSDATKKAQKLTRQFVYKCAAITGLLAILL